MFVSGYGTEWTGRVYVRAALKIHGTMATLLDLHRTLCRRALRVKQSWNIKILLPFFLVK